MRTVSGLRRTKAKVVNLIQGPHLLANFLRQAGEGEASRLDDATGSFATAGLADVAEAVR